MQRKAYVPALAALLVALAAGCSAGSGDDASAADAQPGGSPGSVAAPGKYRTLYEPCGAVQRATLRDLLPGAAELPEEQQEKVYQGTAAVTYDTDRRVGCSWKSDAPDASHHLRIDVERVVSYDPDVSDDDRAQEVYARKKDAAQLPAPADPRDEKAQETQTAGGTPTPTNSTAKSTAGTTGATAGAGVTGTAGAAGGTPSGTPASPEGLEPRELDGLGDAAFLDDALTRAGSTAQHRTVSVVFRTSNVIVTVEYIEQPARTTEIPDSRELQEKAQALARNLAERFNE
ncbi:DUF3558 domain-containing protein [Streptomyces sp. NPDC059909]|uniref:DUF3558 domain-containing protein n=1 Tax=Streptomyces sp. NPDC059909 TaxID=3346998 RepID=UPI00364CD7FD